MMKSISMNMILLLTSFTVVSGFGSVLAGVTDWAQGVTKADGGDTEIGTIMSGRFCAKEGNHNYCLCKGSTAYGYVPVERGFMGRAQAEAFASHSIDPFDASKGYGSALRPNFGGHLDRCNNAHFGDPNRGQVKDCTCHEGGNGDSFIPRLKFYLEGKANLCLAHTELRNGGRVELREYKYENFANCAWDYDGSTGLIRASGSNFCLDAHNRHVEGITLHLWECSKTNPNQDWLVEIKEVPTGSGHTAGKTTGYLRQRRSNMVLEPMCLQAGCQVQQWTDNTHDEYGQSQCRVSPSCRNGVCRHNLQYPGDRVDNPIFGGGGFDMVGTAGACKTKCEDPDTKDSHGRRCVAFEHSSQDPHAVANCAFAWDCSEIGHWGGGKVYRRNHFGSDAPHMQRWNVAGIPCLSWDGATCKCHANGDNNYTCDHRRRLLEDATVDENIESVERRKQ